jgi:hypothetical protein
MLVFRSEVDDINLGLEHFYGDFDIVHTRLIASGVRTKRHPSLTFLTAPLSL